MNKIGEACTENHAGLRGSCSKDIIDIAVQIEQNGERVYRRAAGKILIIAPHDNLDSLFESGCAVY